MNSASTCSSLLFLCSGYQHITNANDAIPCLKEIVSVLGVIATKVLLRLERREPSLKDLDSCFSQLLLPWHLSYDLLSLYRFNHSGPC